MSKSKEDQVRELADLVGITIAEEELSEVANRFDSLIKEMDRLKELNLDGVQPTMVFPDEEE